MCLIILTVNCQAICETCPQCNIVPLSHLTNTVVLCRLKLITLTTVSFTVYSTSKASQMISVSNLCMLRPTERRYFHFIDCFFFITLSCVSPWPVLEINCSSSKIWCNLKMYFYCIHLVFLCGAYSLLQIICYYAL